MGLFVYRLSVSDNRHSGEIGAHPSIFSSIRTCRIPHVVGLSQFRHLLCLFDRIAGAMRATPIRRVYSRSDLDGKLSSRRSSAAGSTAGGESELHPTNSHGRYVKHADSSITPSHFGSNRAVQHHIFTVLGGHCQTLTCAGCSRRHRVSDLCPAATSRPETVPRFKRTTVALLLHASIGPGVSPRAVGGGSGIIRLPAVLQMRTARVTT